MQGVREDAAEFLGFEPVAVLGDMANAFSDCASISCPSPSPQQAALRAARWAATPQPAGQLLRAGWCHRREPPRLRYLRRWRRYRGCAQAAA